MNWFLIALIAPALLAITNHIDKYLLTKYFKSGEVGSLVLFSSLFSIFGIPIVYLVDHSVSSINLTSILLLSLSGAIGVICLILYFYALEDDEASIVVPFYQTIPIFGFFLGYFVLGEMLSIKEILACLIIITGSVILSLEIGEDRKVKLRKKIVILMLAASFLNALVGVIFKSVAIEEGFWPSLFWTFVGTFITGVFIFFFIRSFRKQFLTVLRTNSFSVLSLNSLNETLSILAEGVIGFAMLQAPIALILTANGFQPFFVFIFGIILTVFIPRWGKESLVRKDLAQKILAIVIIILGTYLLGEKSM